MTYMPTFYDILGLPLSLQNEPVIPAHTLRGAKLRAFLKNHPDKSSATLKAREGTYSIDQISEAFSTLSNPTCRAKYDQELKIQNATTNGRQRSGQDVFRTGVEIVDLDDLEANDAQRVWYRSCRCGDTQGFLVSEADLEEAVDEGEVNVGCRGCSLWLKVLFGVVEEEEEETQDEPENSGEKKLKDHGAK